MDLLLLQTVIEKIIEAIFSQGTGTIENLKLLLELIVAGVHSIAILSDLVARYPVLVEVASKLLKLINAGADIPEIIAALVQFVNSGAIAIDAVIQLLQIMIGGLAIF